MRKSFLNLAGALCCSACVGFAAQAQAQGTRGVDIHTLESGEKTVSMTQEMRDAWAGYEPQVPEKITCTSHVDYPVISADYPKTAKVNRAIKALAAEYVCEDGVSETGFHTGSTELIGPVFSMTYTNTYYPYGANGGCHSSSGSKTVNLRTGDDYTVSDLVSKEDRPAFRSYVVEQVKQTLASENGGYVDKWVVDTVEDRLKDSFDALGLYIQKGHAYIEMNTYMGSCAGGSHAPMEIPHRFITETPKNRLLTNTLVP